MTTEATGDGDDELHELHQEKDSQVLEREPLEAELMDDERSEAGEDIEAVEDE